MPANSAEAGEGRYGGEGPYAGRPYAGALMQAKARRARRRRANRRATAVPRPPPAAAEKRERDHAQNKNVPYANVMMHGHPGITIEAMISART